MPRYVIEYQREYSDVWLDSGNYVSPEMARLLGRRLRLHDVDFPSLEDAQREAVYQQQHSTSGLIYRARDTRPAPPEPEGPMRDYWNEWTTRGELMAEAAQRTVRIYRRNSRWVIDSAGRDVPLMSALLPYIPLSARTTGRIQYQVIDALTSGMNPQMLAGALAAYFTEHPNTRDAIRVEEGQANLPDNMAYLAFGDHVYRMVPVRQVSSGRAMKAMREKLAQEMRTLRTGLEQQAGVEARTIIQNAQMEVERIKQEIAAKQQELKTQVKFPSWTLGYPVKSNGETTWLLRETHLTITQLVHGTRIWPMSPPASLFVDLWFPLSGLGENVMMQTNRHGYLPHISTASACMKIGEKVREIKGPDTFELFAMQVVRTMGTINLASLLNTDWKNWRQEIQESIPVALHTWLTANAGDRHAQAISTGLPPAPNQERPEETWTTR